MTLFRLLHGQAWYIFQNECPADVIAQGGFVDRLRWLPHVPKSWRKVIRKMMADDTNDRYSTTQEVLNAISALPIEPSWTTSVTPELVRWELRSLKRLNIVEWNLHAERKHEWKAWSQPIGEGRNKTLGHSERVIGRQQVERELETYFR
ncbi:hypothetical protein D9M71_498130 [compost metagenome]